MEYNKAIAIIAEANSAGIKVIREGDKLRLRVPNGQELSATLREEISRHKQLLLDYLQYKETEVQGSIPAQMKAGMRLPLSFAQERMWLVDRMGQSAAYHLSGTFRITGELNVPAMEKALQAIVQRHTVLRTAIKEEDGQPYQIVQSTDWKPEYLSAETPHITEFIREAAARSFDLSRGQLLRVLIIRQEPAVFMMSVVVHHIAYDAWSLNILVQELIVLYNGYAQGKPAVLPSLPVQYGDYAIWQRQQLTGAMLEEQCRYWKEQLKNVVPFTLHNHAMLPEQGTAAGQITRRVLDQSLLDALTALSNREGATLFMTLLTAFKILLHRYTGSRDICVGTSVANRDLPETEHLIGFFVNLLALRTQITDHPSFSSLLQQVKQTTLAAFDHQQVPYEKVIEALGKSGSEHPLFNMVFVLHNTPPAAALQLEGVSIAPVRDAVVTVPQFELGLELTPLNNGLEIRVEYRADLHAAAAVSQLLDHYQHLLTAIVTDSRLPIGRLPLLSAAAVTQLTYTFNNTTTDYPADQSITGIFESQAMQTPDAIALVSGLQSFTYRELNAAASGLAGLLQQKRVKSGNWIAICMERSPEMIISILAILKCGAGYMPLDPDYPAERLQHMLQDGQPSLLITHGSIAALPEVTSLPEILDLSAAGPLAENAAPVSITSDNIAYLMYTSGSTGLSKGVVVDHGNVVSLVKGVTYVDFSPQAVILATGSPSFDATTFEYWGALLNGGTLVLCPKEVLFDVQALKQVILAHQVNTMWFTAGWFNQLVATDLTLFSTLKTIVVGGDRLLPAAISQVWETYPDIKLVNGYGPTENTTFSLTFHIRHPQKDKEIPVGIPLSNRSAYILDSYGQLCPPGITGEICVGGTGLSKGYWNQPSLTAEKFVEVPQLGRLYKTGDLGCWQTDGTILFCGRVDNQVKIRGFRVEPGEVENVLQQADGVEQAVVVVQENSQGDKQLVAYVKAVGFDQAAMLQFAQKTLPDYMVPAALVPVTDFPLTSNGKVDRAKLQQLPVPEIKSETGYTPPRNELESAMVNIWEQLLERSPIGIYDNFFEMGGHSLLAVRVIAAVRKTLEREISIRDIFEAPAIAGQAALLLSRGQDLLLPALTPRPQERQIPLSFSQERIWFIDRMQGSTQYHMPWVFRLTGNVNSTALEAAFREVVNRHEVLRTVIQMTADGIPYQQILPPDNWRMEYTDISVAEAQQLSLETYIHQVAGKPFDLAQDLMLRVQLVRMADDDYKLIVVLHHIAFDGWSIDLFLKELIALYNGSITGVMPLLPLPEVQYADYACWQRNCFTDETLEKQLIYWTDKLKDVPPLELPLDFMRPPRQSINGDMVHASLSKDIYDQLLQLSRAEGCTLFITLLAVFKVLLFRYTGQDDICVGTPLAGRRQQEVEGLIGFFVSTLALRSRINGELPFTGLLQEVKTTTLEGYEHQDVPFEKIVERLGTARDVSRHPVFQAMFTLQNTPSSEHFTLGEMEISGETYWQPTALFDIDMDVIEVPEGLQLSIAYCSDLFSGAAMTRMLGDYCRLISAILADPGTPVQHLRFLSPADELLLLKGFNGHHITLSPDLTVLQLFREQVSRAPDATAVVLNDIALSYRELDGLSDRLAYHLQQKGVTAEVCVGICLQRSPDIMVAILGILKAGGAYVPMDPAWPAERMIYLLADASITQVVVHDVTQPAWKEVEVINITDYETTVPAHWEPVPVLPSQLAYIIYTSGTTGTPKGAMIAHHNLVSISMAWRQQYELDSHLPVTMSLAGIYFDVFTGDWCRTLLNGGKMIIVPEEQRLDAAVLLDIIRLHRVNMFESTPAVIINLVQQMSAAGITLPDLRLLIVGSDICSPEHFRYLHEQLGETVRIINSYGVTEATIDAAFYDGPPVNNHTIPIGKPMHNVTCYILDEWQQPVPPGVYGELYLGGAGVGRGYLNKPALTTKHFVEVPGLPDKKLYRTGDKARWLPDGNLEMTGRKDDQLKIRGYRIEPGEIEAVIKSAPAVSQAAVMVRDNQQGDKQLIACICVNGTFDKAAIREHLQQHLPGYMIPAVLLEIPEIPLSANGKVDKKKLGAMALPPPEQMESEAPRNELEAAIAGVWATLLEIQRIGIHDNFFEMGGHSLLVVRVIAALRKTINREVAIRDIFNFPTIALLAAHISKTDGNTSMTAILPQVRPVHIPLSFAQERLWFIDQLQGSVQYHMHWVFRFRELPAINALESAFREIVNRHEVLRTVIREDNGVPYQHILPADSWHLQFMDSMHLQGSPEDYAKQVISTPFRLDADSMLRVHVLSSGELIIVLHHIAFDGWSMSILVNELQVLYRSYASGAAAQLSLPVIQYADYAIWQRNYLRGERLNGHLAYWTEKLSGTAPTELPTDYPRPPVPGIRGDTVSSTLSSEACGQLLQLSNEEGGTLFMTLLAAFQLLLYRYTGQEDICTGTILANRRQQELEPLIGFFVNTLAIRSHVRHDMPFRELLQQVCNTLLSAYEHQDVPFEKVVEQLGIARDTSRHPLFQVMFVLQNTPNTEMPELGNGELTTAAGTIDNAIFDLNINITHTTTGLDIAITYRTDLFKKDTVERMLAHYLRILHDVSNECTQSVGKINLLPEQETAQLLHASMAPALFPFSFQEQLRTILNTGGSRPAVEYNGKQLSYDALGRMVNNVAAYLQTEKGILPGDRVVLMTDRSELLLVALLGILYAGAVYVPVDISTPEERARYIIKDVEASLVITTGMEWEDDPFIHLHTLIDAAANVRQGWEAPLLPPDAPAYIIFTSGSTGQPKGVQVNHGNLNHLCAHICHHFAFDHPVVPFLASHGFDISLFQLLMPLLQQGTVIVADKKNMEALDELIALLQHSTVLDTVPAVYRLLLAHIHRQEIPVMPHITGLFIGGDLIDDGILYELSQVFPRAVITVLYGPTEGTLFCTYLRYPPGTITPDTRGRVIGRPIAGAQVLILNSDGCLQPYGVAGEICIGGNGVSDGYLHQQLLTAQHFIPNPYGPGNIYRTGDMACRLTDGTIWFLGRQDGQVKIHGYRIELAEVEGAMQHAPGVRQVAVAAIPDHAGAQQLVAYIVPAPDYDRGQLVTHVQQLLPAYMIPGIILTLAALPLTDNGKINRKALPAPETLQDATGTYEAPRNAVESSLAAIWEELLEKQPIGINDNFFQLGGHSLLAMRVIAAVRKKMQVQLTVRDLFNAPHIAALATLMAGRKTDHTIPVLVPQDKPALIPLSFSQERLWFIDQLRGSVQYHMPFVFRITGLLDVSRLEHAFRQIVQRYEVLRTVIRQHGENGTPHQVITAGDQFHLHYISRVSLSLPLPDYLTGVMQAPFSLLSDNMLRVHLIKISEEVHQLVVVIHHIAADGWSMGVLLRELGHWYNHPDHHLPIPVLQYADYAIWQRRYLQGIYLEQQLDYWKQQLTGVGQFELPADHPRPMEAAISGGVEELLLDNVLHHHLQQLSDDTACTLFMTLLTAFKVLLFRYTGETDLCIGTPVAGRQLQETENMIGFFVNTLAIRNKITGEATFRTLLQQVRQTLLSAYEYQEVPFEKVVDALGVSRDMSRHPLFQVMFSLQNTPETGALELEGCTAQSLLPDAVSAQFDLSMTILPVAQGLEISVTYNTALFEPATITRLLTHYRGLLEAIAANNELPVAELPLLSKEEVQQLEDFSSNHLPACANTTLLERFGDAVNRAPDAVAVLQGDTSVSYHALNEWADTLASRLLLEGSGRNTCVAICLDRSPEMIVALLGILKAGAGFVPIDPDYPEERIRFILKDCNAAAVVTTRSNMQPALQMEGVKVLYADDLQLAEKVPDIRKEIQPDDTAYIIYTSGTTGQPKGVVIPHRAIVSYVLHQTAAFHIDHTENIIQVSGFCFDAALEQIFLALLNGATLTLITKEMLLAPEMIQQLLLSARVTHLHATPSLLQSLGQLSSPWLRRVVAGGEKCSTALADYWSRQTDFYNQYGPTETTITATEYHCPKGTVLDKEELPIGRPIGNTRIYILDAGGNPVPIGVWGEMYIGGEQVGSGYLNRETLTAYHFVPDRFNGGMMYRSGDIARWRADGNLLFKGRTDDQVKIRGFRIEPGEIEHTIRQAAGITDVIVKAVPDAQGAQRLVAYVVTTGEYDRQQLQTFLQQQLPAYMIPGFIIPLPSIPLTSNGKIDHQQLPAPETVSKEDYTAPRNETELLLARIWQELLGVSQISIYDNFFERGGDSIITVQVVSRCRREGIILQPRDLFLHQTIAGLSQLLEERSSEGFTMNYEQGILTGTSGLLPIQQRFLEDPAQHFNQSILLETDKQITAAQLSAALEQLLLQHDALRFRYTQTPAGWSQTYSSDTACLETMAIPDTAAIAGIGAQYQSSLDLTNGPVFRAIWMQLPDSYNRNRLLLIAHHLVMDGVSWRILLDDLHHLLKGGQPGAKTAAYRQWYNVLERYAQSAALLSQRSYWQRIAGAYTPLPPDIGQPGTPVRYADIQQHTLYLDREHTRLLLQEAGQAYHTAINDLLLGALTKVISGWMATPSVVIGLESHGREAVMEDAPDISSTVGWFTAIYPVLLRMPDHGGWDTLIREVKEQLRQVPHKGMGYGVLRYLTDKPADKEPWDIVFNYLGQLENVMPGDGLLFPAAESAGAEVDDNRLQSHLLDISCLVDDGRLMCNWSYSSHHFTAATISLLAKKYLETLTHIIEHCANNVEKGMIRRSPSDFGLAANIPIAALDRFLDSEATGADDIMSF